jgi:hypothetical protein
MNARTVRKILMKSRSRYLFGSRAFVTVKVPLNVFPELPPEVPDFGKPYSFQGMWEQRDNGVYTFTSIRSLSSTKNPMELVRDEHSSTPRCVELDPYSKFWRWFEGTKIVYRCDTSLEYPLSDPKKELLQRVELPEEHIADHKNRQNWFDNYCQGSSEKAWEDPLVGGFLWAGNEAKATYAWIKGDDVFLQYAVKWFYPKRKLRFSAKLARAVSRAKRSGHDVRVYRG